MPFLDIGGWTPRVGEAEWPGQPLGSEARCNCVRLSAPLSERGYHGDEEGGTVQGAFRNSGSRLGAGVLLTAGRHLGPGESDPKPLPWSSPPPAVSSTGRMCVGG